MNVTTEMVQLSASPSVIARVHAAVFWLPLPLYLITISMLEGVEPLWTLLVAGSGIHIALGLMILFIAHELLHVVAFLFGGVERKNIAFQFERDSGSIAINVNQPISIRTWRISLLAPFIGLSAILVPLASLQGPLSIAWPLLALSVSGCAYDIAAYVALRNLPGDRFVLPKTISEHGNLYLQAYPSS